MLRVMAEHPDQIEPTFAAMFGRNPVERIFRFLDEAARPAEVIELDGHAASQSVRANRAGALLSDRRSAYCTGLRLKPLAVLDTRQQPTTSPPQIPKGR